MLKNFTIILFLSLFAVSCKNEAECTDCDEDNNPVEQPQEEMELKDTVQTPEPVEEVIDETVDKNYVENKKRIVKKFGEQWDFCRCVRANDSLNTMIMNGAELNDEFMSKFDETEKKCKAFLVMSPNLTPEERAAHQAKIDNCLKDKK